MPTIFSAVFRNAGNTAAAPPPRRKPIFYSNKIETQPKIHRNPVKMPGLQIFPNGTEIRHEAFIRDRKISTQYGVIREGKIETNILGTDYSFGDPLDFIKEHKLSKIKQRRYQSVCGNPWNIIEYYDTTLNSWQKLSDFLGNQSGKSEDSSTIDTSVQEICQSTEDDAESFVTCMSELSTDRAEEAETTELCDNLPFKITWEHIDTIEVWQWRLYATNEFMESWRQSCYEYQLDEANLDEIEDELNYESFSKEYPWITHHNLPYEEKSWIALKTQIPQFGEVWMDAYGHCWEINDHSGQMANAGKYIGRWSWELSMMNLGEKEPSPIMDPEEFWDILQDFSESV
jgi:hypothetical protein